jgi:hypothetical protein
MGISSLTYRLRDIQLELDKIRDRERLLISEKESLTLVHHKECQHKKVIYTDGHVHSDPDDWDIPEVRICLSCGLSETGTREHNYDAWKRAWGGYKILIATPIRRFCVPGRMMRDTVAYYTDMIDRQVRYARERGEVVPGKKRDEMLETELNRYWEHVKDRVMRLPYPARVKVVKKIGYPA